MVIANQTILSKYCKLQIDNTTIFIIIIQHEYYCNNSKYIHFAHSSHMHTHVAKKFTFVCLPFFLKVIEKRIVVVLQVGIAHIWMSKYTILSHSLSNMHSAVWVLKTNLLMRQPAGAAAIMTRSSSTKVMAMATPMIRGCVEPTSGVSSLLGPSKWRVVRRWKDEKNNGTSYTHIIYLPHGSKHAIEYGLQL